MGEIRNLTFKVFCQDVTENSGRQRNEIRCLISDNHFTLSRQELLDLEKLERQCGTLELIRDQVWFFCHGGFQCDGLISNQITFYN